MRIIVLLQVASYIDLQRQRSNIENLLSLPGVSGFSVRVPGNILNPSPGVWNLSILQLAREIANGKRKEFQTRTMGGRWTPAHARGNTMFYDSSEKLPGEQFQLANGTPIPVCHDVDGTRNDRYFNWCVKAYTKLSRFGKQSDCRVQHFFWPGLTWAEVAIINQMSEMTGFSYDVHEQFHLDLMKKGLNLFPGDVEWALSGHVVSPFTTIFNTLGNHAETNDRYIINRNDIGGPHQGTGTTLITKLRAAGVYPPRHGWQMWGTQTDYPWSTILDIAEEQSGGFDRADYLEIYPQSFASSALKSEIAQRFG